MDTGVIIAIVVAALILLAVLWFAGRKGRERRYETRRHEAREIRREAEVGRAQADKTRADEAGAEFDRQHAQASTARTAATDTGGDQSVEHYEHTSEPGVETERRFERDEDGGPPRWSDAWRAQTRLPRAIAIDLETTDGRKRSWSFRLRDGG